MIDIESLTIKFLNDNGFTAFGDVPKDRPEEFVTCEQTGGAFDDFVIEKPTLAIQCWSTSRSKAKRLAMAVDELIRSLPDVYTNVISANRNTLYNFPDPSSQTPRYQIVVDFITQD